MRVGGLEPRVHGDPGRRVRAHAGALEAQLRDVARAAGCDQHLIRNDLRAVREPQRLAGIGAASGSDAHAGAQPHAVPQEGIRHALRRLGLLLRQDLRRELEQLDLGPEPRESLPQLAADRARTEHRETPRLPGEIEDRLVGERRDSCEPRKRWNVRSRACGDHGAASAQRRLADADLVRAREARLSEEHIHPRRCIALDRVVHGDRRYTAMLAWGLQRFEPVKWAEELFDARHAGDEPGLARLYTAASLCALTGRPR